MMAGESRKRTFLPSWSGPEPEDRLRPKATGGASTSRWRAAGDLSMQRKEEQEWSNNKPKNIYYVQETDDDRDILL